jgi:general secretion pathway protein K
MNACIASHRPAAARGLALVTVLWVLVLLSLMAASFTATTRTEVNLTRNLVENAQAEALAEAGLARALLALLAGRRSIDLGDPVERLSPELGGALEARPEVAAALASRQAEAEPAEPGVGETLLGFGAPGGAGEAWRADGTVYAWRFGGATLRAAVHSEAGKIDLNAADESLLRGLFLSALWTGPDGEPQGLDEAQATALVDALRDFADPDQLTRLNGAEDPDYRAAGLPWGAKDAAFEAVAELQQVLGMTAPLYRAVAPALTVHSGAKGVDARLAPRAVLLALAGAAGTTGATPGTPETEVVDDYLAARAAAPAGAAPAFPGAAGRAAARARAYTIHAEAWLPGGAVFAREAVVRLGGGGQPYRIEAWRQGRRELFPLDARQ